MKSEGKHLFRLLLLIAVALMIPVLPFLWFGESLDAQINGWLEGTLPPSTVALMVIGLLAGDIFLPVPSSVLNMAAGKALGFWAGTAAAWCGMTIGAMFAFWLVRIFGRPLARRFSSEEELDRVDALARRFGVLVVVLARPVPVLAEASVLLMGTTQLSWWRFLVAVGLSNWVIAAAYAALGNQVNMPIALAASIVFPLLAAVVARLCWPRTGAADRNASR